MAINIEEVQTGISLLDRQHERYFDTVERVLQLCREQNLEPQTIEDLLIRVREYAVDNFDTEEYLMTLENYPEYEEHKAKHDFFKDRIEAFAPRIEGGQLQESTNLAKELYALLVDWFNTQIKDDDMKLAHFLNERNRENT
mgnify:CR=1 FL=1